jgi:hypothetical protein
MIAKCSVYANDAVDEVRRAEFFRKGRTMRDLIKGKKWLLLSRWRNLVPRQRGVLNRLFQLNRRVFKAYMLKESLERLWDYRYEGAMVKYLGKWVDQLRWQRPRVALSEKRWPRRCRAFLSTGSGADAEGFLYGQGGLRIANDLCSSNANRARNRVGRASLCERTRWRLARRRPRACL